MWPRIASSLRPDMIFRRDRHPRTSFHHQPEAQHPKSLAIHKNAGRLLHLSGVKQTRISTALMSLIDPPSEEDFPLPFRSVRQDQPASARVDECLTARLAKERREHRSNV